VSSFVGFVLDGGWLDDVPLTVFTADLTVSMMAVAIELDVAAACSAALFFSSSFLFFSASTFCWNLSSASFTSCSCCFNAASLSFASCKSF